MHKQQVKLIVGLGNPGEQYKKTRHNIGFDSIDYIAQHLSADSWQAKDKLKSIIATAWHGEQKIIFAKPTTFYNLSGESIRAIMDFYKLSIQDLLVIHDELDLPFGTIRTRIGGSDAHNNGIKNVIMHIGEDFARVRIGTSNERLGQIDAADFVLGKLTPGEQKQLPQIFEHTKKFAEAFIQEDKTFTHESIQI
ncbi:MAG TPA: aminoacyl-tRNA hydrolase [Patescibacteria group bacterium]|nr:aminoacyl-tRNA hydrolase [Patescibacteria group bacterium]